MNWIVKNRQVISILLSLLIVGFVLQFVERQVYDLELGIGLLAAFAIQEGIERLILIYVPARKPRALIPDSQDNHFGSKKVLACINVMREYSERQNVRDPRYYEETFLARVFGINYKKLEFASPAHSLTEIWVNYSPRGCSLDEGAELLAELCIVLYGTKDYGKVLFLARAKQIEESRRKFVSSSPDAPRYHFTDPLLEVCKQVDNEILG